MKFLILGMPFVGVFCLVEVTQKASFEGAIDFKMALVGKIRTTCLIMRSITKTLDGEGSLIVMRPNHLISPLRHKVEQEDFTHFLLSNR